MPIVSIIMPTFNSKDFVCQAVDSVINQSFKDWELLIIDDASSDGTAELVNQCYAEERRVILRKLSSNMGAAAARNIGIKAAKGRFIAFLDSDDFWYKNKLSIQMETFSKTDACLIYSSYQATRENDGFTQLVTAPEHIVYKDLLLGNPVGCLTAVFDTKKTGKVYMPEIRMRQDWGLWMRLLRNGGHGRGIQQPLATLRIHKRSLSANKPLAMYYNYQLLRTEGGLTPSRALWGVFRHAYAVIRRKTSIFSKH